eukprot:7391598-Prymnesium_polylepis.2
MAWTRPRSQPARLPSRRLRLVRELHRAGTHAVGGPPSAREVSSPQTRGRSHAVRQLSAWPHQWRSVLRPELARWAVSSGRVATILGLRRRARKRTRNLIEGADLHATLGAAMGVASDAALGAACIGRSIGRSIRCSIGGACGFASGVCCGDSRSSAGGGMPDESKTKPRPRSVSPLPPVEPLARCARSR